MELLAEIIASVFQLLLELGLQLAGEIVGEFGVDAVGEMWRPPRPHGRRWQGWAIVCSVSSWVG